jgi:DNA-binding PadR family transcriptional regulator
MDADERDICIYLKSWAGQFVHQTEISRRASTKRRYDKEPAWAVPALNRLVEKGFLEADTTGHYRLRPRTKKDKSKRWVSPEMRKILQKSGKGFDQVFQIEEEDEFLNE